MKKIIKHLFIFTFLGTLILFYYSCDSKKETQNSEPKFDFSQEIYKTAKPLTRWWWFADSISQEDVKFQLDRIKENNFGGVEIAWVYPLSRKRFKKEEDAIYTARYDWLSPEWQNIVKYTKQYCDSIGLQCDFTYGTGWPFGDSFVKLENSTQVYKPKNDEYKNTYSVSWEYPRKGYILNHLSSEAFADYANIMGTALKPALNGSSSCLFCDSWEVETRKIWTDGFAEKFERKYGYNLIPYMDSIYAKKNADIHYDYMKLVSELVINNFYKQLTSWANANNSYSRSQCSGAPVDILTAYASQDVPESEAMLYEPNFSLIPLSAAVLSGKTIISSETFTCTYGFPKKDSLGNINYRHLKEEQTADLKLVADALFANGVNQIIWHGMPFNPIGVDSISFYATVHVGTAGKLWNEIADFNKYMETVSKYLRIGKTYSEIAVYIPQEDAWTGQEMDNPNPQMPWAWGDYEMRNTNMPNELTGYHPLWINEKFLKDAEFSNNKLTIGDAEFSLLYIDVEFMDFEALKIISQFADKGLKICMKRKPRQAGYIKTTDFNATIKHIFSLNNVKSNFNEIYIKAPIINGEKISNFICKKAKKDYYIFFANPKAQNLSLPLSYGQSLSENNITKEIEITIDNESVKYQLIFKPYQSILLKIDKNLNISEIDINYVPNTPKQ